MTTSYMLDTNICSFIMRERPPGVLEKLQSCIAARHSIVVSAITYSELRFGAIGKKASPKHNRIVDEFIDRVDQILPWGKEAVEASTEIKKTLSDQGTPIGNNDILIAGHAISASCILVTNNTNEFKKVPNLNYEDWV